MEMKSYKSFFYDAFLQYKIFELLQYKINFFLRYFYKLSNNLCVYLLQLNV
jgi:hypothetical protein